MTEFKERLKQLRADFQISQSALADALHVTRSAVNAWELGNSYPNMQCLVSLAKFFNVSADYLLGLQSACTIDISTLPQKERELLCNLLICFKQTANLETS